MSETITYNQQRELDIEARRWTSEENEKQRKHDVNEAEKARKWTTEENAKDRQLHLDTCNG